MLVIDNYIKNKPLVYFVGLSAKPRCEHLDPETRTGSIIEQIIQDLPTIKAIKTNLVKTPPMDSTGKLRYPNLNEMQSGWNQLRYEMNLKYPDVIVTLGQQVSLYLRSQMGVQPAKQQLPSDFSYGSYLSRYRYKIISIHHPSFIYVYRRKEIEYYIESVVLSISALVAENCN